VTEAFKMRSKPESVAAAEAVQDALQVAFVDGNFSPWTRSAEMQTLGSRIAKEDHPAWNGRPTVVFYTCEGATKTTTSKTKKKTTRESPLQSSRISVKVYESIYDVIKSRQACIYSMFVNLVKVDISQITPAQDTFINNKTGPFMGFFNIDGKCVSMLRGSQIGMGSYNRNIAQLLGTPSASRSRYVAVEGRLDKLEGLTRKEYVMDLDIQECLAKAKKYASKKKKSMGSIKMKKLSSTKSIAAIRAEKMQVAKATRDKQIADLRSSLHELTGRAVGCEGCPVCLEKAAAARSAKTSSY
jgi:hypothetical protein